MKFWIWGGGGRLSLKYFYLLKLRLCIDFKLNVNPGTSKKVCGGGGGGGGGGGVLT